MMADRTNSNDATTDNATTTDNRRDSATRRDTPTDRRAFWRPTPDRRREATEQGRRESDKTP